MQIKIFDNVFNCDIVEHRKPLFHECGIQKTQMFEAVICLNTPEERDALLTLIEEYRDESLDTITVVIGDKDVLKYRQASFNNIEFSIPHISSVYRADVCEGRLYTPFTATIKFNARGVYRCVNQPDWTTYLPQVREAYNEVCRFIQGDKTAAPYKMINPYEGDNEVAIVVATYPINYNELKKEIKPSHWFPIYAEEKNNNPDQLKLYFGQESRCAHLFRGIVTIALFSEHYDQSLDMFTLPYSAAYDYVDDVMLAIKRQVANIYRMAAVREER